MYYWNIIFSVFATIWPLTFSDHHWDYGPEATWRQSFPGCSGNQQSPIPLDENSSDTSLGTGYIQLSDYHKSASVSMTNNGHSVNLKFNYDDSSEPRLILGEDDGSSTFGFKELHFHWPSEHVMDGIRYEMEMHMLHKNSQNGKYLVLSHMLEICDETRSGMEDLATAVQSVKNASNTVQLAQLAPNSLIPVDQNICDSFKYKGSFTTPPCTEDVTWLVNKEILCVKQSQMQHFLDVKTADGRLMAGNIRSLQNINGRTVKSHSC